WSPFKSEMDWKIAKWAIQEGIGHNTLDRFLSIPGTVERLGLSYKNMRSLLQIIDSVPALAEWQSKLFVFEDRPNEEHLIQYRDPCVAIQALLGNPAYADQVVYKPTKLF
ncbi:hypothetical protein DENSPDRAFT_748679, partial [Dentipellis sp. KUC8613]